MPFKINGAFAASELVTRGRKRYHQIPKIIDFDNFTKEANSTGKPVGVDAITIASISDDTHTHEITHWADKERSLKYTFNCDDIEFTIHIQGFTDIGMPQANPSTRTLRIYIRGLSGSRIDLVSWVEYAPIELSPSDLTDIELNLEA